MVQIYIKKDEKSSVEEWFIIELQGDLQCEDSEDLSNKFMADLHYNSDGQPMLVIGTHIMYGKLCSLEKPFILLKKNRNRIEKNADEMETECDDMTNFRTEYLIQAVIRRKILFNKRPRPIIFTDFNK